LIQTVYGVSVKCLDTQTGNSSEGLFVLVDHKKSGSGITPGQHLDGTPTKTAATDDKVNRDSH
jgi:hypothetical protein